MGMLLDLGEQECEVLEDVLKRTLGDLRIELDLTSFGDEEEQALEQYAARIRRLLASVRSRRSAPSAEYATLEGLVGAGARW
jgi:hypothetical protein